MLLQHRTRGAFSFLPRQPVHSLLSGRHASRIRGRGLNFEELRGYLPGDDVRSIDWKVTARTQKPHVRVFTEERDRPALLVVDQRLAMFYGTRKNMKSVTAAELAAAGAWRVFDVGDRVGAVVFDDEEIREVRPHRSRRTVMQILHLLVEKNCALRADADIRPEPSMLNRALEGVARVVNHDYLVAIISDFDGADEETTRVVTRLAQHNDVIALPVHDPSSTEIPSGARLVVSDGELQVELDVGKASTRRRLAEMADERLASVMAWQDELGVPVMPISAGEDSLDQVRKLLGQAARGGQR
ncbi:MAG: DUF58 domain-containing protein [Acidobacteriota bacterium]|nr:MAG: DUF58 domain-containing protein [Acidobacteriota bacterium]